MSWSPHDFERLPPKILDANEVKQSFLRVRHQNFRICLTDQPARRLAGLWTPYQRSRLRAKSAIGLGVGLSMILM